jgi:hypothetical protein
MPAIFILALARTSRCLVAGRRMKAGAASKPRILQDERCADCRIKGRMRAGEHQPQPLVGNFSLARRRLQFVGNQAKMVGSFASRLAPPHCVHLPPPRCGQQPRLGIFRNAGDRPVAKRRRKRLG